VALVRVYCGLGSAPPAATRSSATAWLTAAVVDDAGRLIDVCDISDDPVGYAELGALLAERSGGTTGIAVAADSADHQVTLLLAAAGRLLAVITQNTDGLHQDSGSKRVIELHGSGRKVQCLDCGHLEPRFEVQARLDVEMPPRCRNCGGTLLKPTVVLFGEPMPVAAMQEAFELARNADVILVVGSSLVVYPAAEVPLVALRAGARMIVINAEPTPFDRFAQIVIHGRSGEVLPQIAALISA